MDPRCPRNLTRLPCQSCPEGRKAMDAARRGEVAGCPWFVADAESQYCFFKYMADNGQEMETHDIAPLLMMDDNEVKRVVQSFRRRIGSLFGIETDQENLD
jgi:hypothetical protein